MTAVLTRSFANSTGFYTLSFDQVAAGIDIARGVDFEELAQSFFLPNSRLEVLALTRKPPEDWHEEIGDLF